MSMLLGTQAIIRAPDNFARTAESRPVDAKKTAFTLATTPRLGRFAKIAMTGIMTGDYDMTINASEPLIKYRCFYRVHRYSGRHSCPPEQATIIQAKDAGHAWIELHKTITDKYVWVEIISVEEAEESDAKAVGKQEYGDRVRLKAADRLALEVIMADLPAGYERIVDAAKEYAHHANRSIPRSQQ